MTLDLQRIFWNGFTSDIAFIPINKEDATPGKAIVSTAAFEGSEMVVDKDGKPVSDSNGVVKFHSTGFNPSDVFDSMRFIVGFLLGRRYDGKPGK
jgi:hypothetical protein